MLKPRGWRKWLRVDVVSVGINAAVTIATIVLVVLTQQMMERQDAQARVESRAYVTVPEVKSVWTPDGYLIVGVSVGNSGATPATKVVVDSHVKLVADAKPPEPRVPAPATLPSGASITSILDLKMYGATANADLRAGKYELWIYGRIDYEDVFGRPHWTTFNFKCADPKIDTPMFAAEPTGNEMSR